MELEVLDGQATVEPLLFVIGTDREDFIGLTAMIQIGSIYLGGQIVDLYQRIGIRPAQKDRRGADRGIPPCARK